MLGNDHDHTEFDATQLTAAKRAAGLSVSVCLPARDEEATVGLIVGTIRDHLVESVGLVDEIVVVDDGSIDETAAAARAAGARVEASADLLPEFGPGLGKGDALWRSLHAASGDLVCWLDADLVDFEPHFVTGLLGPLLTDPAAAFVKAHYDRPTAGDAGGGRVTELLARPVISRLVPKLAPIVQPLGGEYAGRREVLERLPFATGWGVEVGLLVEVLERFGARAIAQVDLGVRRHRSRSLEQLGPQAMAILVTALRHAGVDAGEGNDDLLRPGDDGRVTRVPVELGERPPIIEVAAYRARRREQAVG